MPSNTIALRDVFISAVACSYLNASFPLNALQDDAVLRQRHEIDVDGNGRHAKTVLHKYDEVYWCLFSY